MKGKHFHILDVKKMNNMAKKQTKKNLVSFILSVQRMKHA